MKIMKFYATAAVVMVLSLLLTETPAMAQSLKGNGNMQTQERNVAAFKGINVSGGFRVELSQGNKEALQIEAEENLMDNIVTEVKNGVLHIYSRGSISTKKGMKAYVTVKELNSLNISGGVRVSGNSTFKANSFDLDMSGGSKATLALNTKVLKAEMNGASKVELTGSADEVQANMSGASELAAEGLEAKRVQVNANGASQVKVFAAEVLDIHASGASRIAYRGSPSITSNVSGATRISKL